MTTRGKTALVVILVFVLGLLAGSGLGAAYGRSNADAALQQKVSNLEAQYRTVNDNYLIVVREYNKLYGIKAVAQNVETVAAAPAAKPAAAVQAAPTAAPTAEPAAASSEAAPEATAAPESAVDATPAPEAASAAESELIAQFEGMADGGTGPQEGPPPLTMKFTDRSTGEVTSWEWTFGDGESSTEQNPEHVYKLCPDDLCTVTLKVCGPSGCAEETKKEYIWVSESCTGC